MIRLNNSTIAIVTIGIAWFRPSAAQTNINTADDYPWPDGPGKAIIKKSCLSCHAANVIVKKPGRTQDQWADVLSTMAGRGAIISDDDAETLIQYLATNFGPDSKSTAAPSGSEPQKTPSPQDFGDAPHSASDVHAPINVNKASAEELAWALGLTPAEAQLIVRYREQHRDFKTWRDVASVTGVPFKKIQDSQKRLTF